MLRMVMINISLGSPIRISADLWVFAPPHGFSQLITSFFASESQGIPHVPLHTSFFFFAFTRLFVAIYLIYYNSILGFSLCLRIIYISFSLIYNRFQYVNVLHLCNHQSSNQLMILCDPFLYHFYYS